MRAANYSSMNIFNLEQIKEINHIIKLNFIKGNDDYAKDAVKTSDVKFVNYGKVQKEILKAKKRFGDKFDKNEFLSTNNRVVQYQDKIKSIHLSFSNALEKDDLLALKK